MKPQDASTAPRIQTWLAAALSALVIALGMMVLLGWHTQNPRMTQWVSGRNPMVYNTALSFLLLGAAMLAASLGHRRLAAALAILGALPSWLALFQYAAGEPLGIDELLMKPGGSSEYPGRIAPNTAVCLLLVSAALLLCLPGRKGFRWRALGSPLLASVALGISAVAVAGYVTGFATSGWGQFIPMAVPTSVGLTLLSLAALSLNWRESRLCGREVPSWLYLVVTVAAMVMAVSLWVALATEERARIGQAVAGQLEAVQVRLRADLESRMQAVGQFARRWEQTGPPDRQRWDFETGLLAKEAPGLQAVGWADPDSRICWVYPHEPNQALLGADLSSDASRRTAIQTARDSRRTVVTRPMQLPAGGDGINAYLPVYRGPGFQGFIVAGFRIQDLLPHVVDPTLAPGYALAIYDGDQRIYFRAPQDEQSGRVWERQAFLPVENARWTVKLWPAPLALATVESTASKAVLAAGLLLAVLLGSAVYTAQAAQMKKRLAERARAELEKEVAERRRAERELDQFFTLAPDMLCVAGFDGTFKRVNAAWERVLGVPPDRLLAEPSANFLHPDDLTASQRALQNPKADTGISSFENRFRAQDGSFRWLRWNSRPLPERNLILAAARDITEEKAAAEALQRAADELAQRVRERTAEAEQATRALHESEELFRKLFEESPIGTVMLGLDHRLSHMNKALCELLAYDASELLGRALEDFTYREDLEPGGRLLDQMIGGEIPGYRLTQRFVRKNGEIVWGDLTAAVLRDERGAPKTVLGMIRDVTERQWHDQELARLDRELRARLGELTAVNQELETFNYSIAHDLRAPLRHIDGFSKILREDLGTQLPDAARKYLELISGGARRMGLMIDQLLELSRTSRKELVRRPTGLKSLVEEALADLRPELEGRQIEWRIGELPSVDCDPALVRRVFAHLISNAVKFSRPRKTAVIEVGEGRDQGQPVLFVRDNGVGFSMKYAGKLFGVFQRLHRQEDFEGTGAGLAIVQRIVRKHGGRIWAEAQLETGATFYFTLDQPAEPRPEPEREVDDAERRIRDSVG